MGLDLVELVIRVEETFGIQIPDRVAGDLDTPAKVRDFILTQVEESPAPLPCMSQKAFHALRREMTRHLSLSRSSRICTWIKTARGDRCGGSPVRQS